MIQLRILRSFQTLPMLKRKSSPPEFRLVPNVRGDYYLERWHSDIRTYLYEETVADQAEAEGLIANLGRKTLYWVEAED